MIRSFRRLVAWFAKDKVRSPATNKQPAGPAPNPLTTINQTLREALLAVEQQFTTARQVDEHLQVIEEQVSHAWQERDSLLKEHYQTLRGLLRVHDDCQSLGISRPEVQPVLDHLGQLLRELALEPITTGIGERFQPDTQCCEETAESADQPAGIVLRILETGYVKRWADGATVIVRPARVVVSKRPTESKEPS